ncbi:hypothetical protein K6Y31_10425 [Motilimonas cestriensis]|uniref:Uncharacterized protein n=1 Tax=Motilimonas cestriensis TaxID=2742685 RepID=A0ABS8W8A3_9GAMM|nr:hypothetical protein [Motilimonas cestriensis]MCE2595229.1 hypothetical protein [Motilimonas cestriensis]
MQPSSNIPIQLRSYQGLNLMAQLDINLTEAPLPIEPLSQICTQDELTSLHILVDASQVNSALLEQLFVLLQGLYRPLMRGKNKQVWVIWHHSDESIIRAGAQALCQIAALELARKGVSINFIHQHHALSEPQRQCLLHWQFAHYCTAQAFSLPEAPLSQLEKLEELL